MNSIADLIEKIDNLTIRERAAILLGVLAVMYTLWDSLLMQPLQNQQKAIKAELQQKQATQLALNAQVQKIIEENQKDPNTELEKQLNELKAELKEINNNIQVSTAHLIPPKDMAKVLETVLNKTKGLTLLNVKSLGASTLIKQDKNKTDAIPAEEKNESDTSTSNDIGNAYKHGLRIEFAGDYMSTLRYLTELESLEWKFFWDSFEYSVDEYPRAKAAIQVYTMSLNKNWIDV